MTKVAYIRQNTGCNNISLTAVFSGNPSNITIGNDSVIRDRCMIRFKHGKIAIGNNVVISHNVTLLAGEHNYSKKDVNILSQGMFEGETVIENDVWIGSNATVLSGVRIGKGAVIGSMSLVNRSVPDYEVWGGNPAKKLKSRC